MLNDDIFKAVFTKETAESRKALKSLLSTFLEKELSVLEIKANEPPINSTQDRLIRYDVSVEFNDGELADVEMTVYPKKYEALRFEYYTARLFVTQDIKGQEKTFRDLRPTYHLSFLYGNLYPDKEWLHRFVYYDAKNSIKMGGRTEIVTVELKKLIKVSNRPIEELGSREIWGLFMVYHREYKKYNIIQKIITMDEGVAAANTVLDELTEKEWEASAARAREKFDLDAKEELWEMKEAAREKGREEGREEERKYFLELLDQGLSVEEIKKKILTTLRGNEN